MAEEPDRLTRMAGEESAATAGERAYYRLPAQGWQSVWPVLEPRLRELRARLDAVLDDRQRDAGAPSPAELALELGGAVTALFEQLAPEERDLRDVVTTLRTALALCWDMYSYQEAGRVTVQAHMERLQADIEGFEAQLEQVQEASGPLP
jgi:phage shock protein A